MEIVIYIVVGVVILWGIAFFMSSNGHKKRMKVVIEVVNEALKHKISTEHEMILLGYINKSNADPDYCIDIHEKFQPILAKNGLEKAGFGVADMTSQHLKGYTAPVI